MKKLIALLLALVMVLGLVACASKTTDETPKTDDSAAAPADTETTDNTAEPADTETTDTAEETTGESVSCVASGDVVRADCGGGVCESLLRPCKTGGCDD